MAKIETNNIRNIALLGHGGSGKTSLAEAMLYLAGESDRLGNVTAGNTVCDYDPEEIARKISISASLAPMMWKNTKINVLDTPGYLDFTGEVLQALRVADCAVLTVDGKAGIEVGTEISWDLAVRAGLPRAIFINKLDDGDAHYDRVLDSLRETFGNNICPLVIPMKKGGAFAGVIDLIDQKAYVTDDKGKVSESEIPADSDAETYREMLMEAIAGTDEELMMKYFDGEEIGHDEAVAALRNGVSAGEIVPVLCGAAIKLAGVPTFLDQVAKSFPSPLDKKQETLADGKKADIAVDGNPSIFVFKTVADPFVGKMSFFKVMSGTVKRDQAFQNQNSGETEKFAHIYTVKGKKQTEVEELSCGDIGMVAKLNKTNTNDTLTIGGSVEYAPIIFPTPYMVKAMTPASKGDEGKISQSIAKMVEEDYTLRFENDAETKQLLIYGLGEVHLSVLAARLKSRFGLNINFEVPRIAYREKITKSVDVEGKHKKQNGGSGQYGHVKMRFSPSEEEGLTFTVSVVGGTVPKNFYPAVEKGIQDAMSKGAAGFPLMGLVADLYDGSYHAVDSDELSFKTAASLAYKKCLEEAAPVILEPVGDLLVTVPEGMVGDVMGDLNKRRGSVMGMEPTPDRKGYTTVQAVAPKSEIMDYPIVLRAMTQGRGSFEYKVTGYDVVPGNLAVKIKEEYKQA